MSDSLQTLLGQLRDQLSSYSKDIFLENDQITIEIAPESLLTVCQELRDQDTFQFEQLSDLCGVDYLAFGKADWETQNTTNTGFSRGVDRGVYNEDINKPARFAVIYHLISIKHNQRVRVRCYLKDGEPRVDSVVSLWAVADWYEREVFDLYGIMFEGHPDLRRILTDYGFIGHPFRKDFPLEGNVEVRYDPDKRRVVYQPVTITNRVLVPKVIRHDNRYEKAQQAANNE